MGQQGRLGPDAETHHLLRRHDHDLREFGGSGVVVHMGVDQEDLALRQQQRVHAGINGTAGAAVAAGLLADDLVDVGQVVARAAPGATDHAVHVTLVQQHGADQREAPAHLDLGELCGGALALGHAPVGLPEIAVAIILLDIHDVVIHAFAQAQAEFLDTFRHDGRPADERRPRDALVHHDLAGTQHALFLALAVGHALARRHLGGGKDGPHHRARGIHEALQALTVRGKVGDGPQRDPTVHRRLGHGRRDLHHQPRVEGFGDQVLRAEAQLLPHVRRRHHFALLGLCQFGDGVHGRNFHLQCDGGRTRIQRAAEDVGETQDVVDLIGIV